VLNPNGFKHTSNNIKEKVPCCRRQKGRIEPQHIYQQWSKK
jgi:hypothetical protein